MKKTLILSLSIYVLYSCNPDNEFIIEDYEVHEVVETEDINVGYEDIFAETSLNALFSNALVSDNANNIKRNERITITQYDNIGNKIKTSFKNLEELLIPAAGNQSWFITQNSEASTVVEILNVDAGSGWITLGKTYHGKLNTDIGANLEFFNPFINYEIINNQPLFNPYPTQVSEGTFNYIQSGGIIEKSDGTYILLTPVIFGSHNKRSIYYATSSDLENWTFHNEKILSTDMIPFAKTQGNVFSSNNPYKLENGTLLVLLGVEQPNGNYTSAYMIIDENLKIIQQPKEIMISDWNGPNQNSFPLSITKFNNEFRILFHRRNPNFIDREVHEVIASNLFDALDLNKNIKSSKIIHRGNTSHGYLRGKADDASYLEFNSNLYILLGSEEISSNYLTSRNREYGLMSWDGNNWKHDIRSPLLINPVQLFHKYPIYSWAWCHSGGFVSPIIKDETLFIFMTFASDNPDYFISGIKIPLTPKTQA